MIANAEMDWALYRYLVENAFAKLKQFRALATRYDKLKRNYDSMVAMACGLLWLPIVTKRQQALAKAINFYKSGLMTPILSNRIKFRRFALFFVVTKV